MTFCVDDNGDTIDGEPKYAVKIFGMRIMAVHMFLNLPII